MNNILILTLINQVKNVLVKSGIKEPAHLTLFANYETDKLEAKVRTESGEIKTSELSLSQNSQFTDIVKQQVKNKLKFDKINLLILYIDLLECSVTSDVYYILNGEKLFLKLEKI